MKKILFALGMCAALTSNIVMADERYFTYVYESDVLPQYNFEMEQQITNESGKADGHYTRWEYRTELEYGVTEHYQTSLYMNWDYTHSEGVTGVEEADGAKFRGFSWENVYQFLNPNLDPVGFAGYIEYGTDGDDQELENKLILSKPVEDWLFALNATYELEWEKENGATEKEAELEFSAGASYKITEQWSTGLEVRNVSAFPDGLDLNGREYTAWSAGPNVHYAHGNLWTTATVLPQIWGNGDGASGGRNLVHDEKLEARLIVGYNF